MNNNDYKAFKLSCFTIPESMHKADFACRVFFLCLIFLLEISGGGIVWSFDGSYASRVRSALSQTNGGNPSICPTQDSAPAQSPSIFINPSIINPSIFINSIYNNSTESDQRTNVLFSDLFQRQAIRDKLIERANRYLRSSAAVYPGKIVATAFVVEGLLEFGLSPQDSFIQEKVAWLQSHFAADKRIYNSDGEFLPSETAWTYRAINQFSRKTAQLPQKSMAGQPSFLDNFKSISCKCNNSFYNNNFAKDQLTEAEYASAYYFLCCEFSTPELADRRGRLMGEYQLSSEQYRILANWDQYNSIQCTNPAEPWNCPFGNQCFPDRFAFGTPSVSSSPISKSAESVLFALTNRDNVPALICRSDRREGYFVLARSIVLLI